MNNTSNSFSIQTKVLQFLTNNQIELPANHTIKFNEIVNYRSVHDEKESSYYIFNHHGNERQATLIFGSHRLNFQKKVIIDLKNDNEIKAIRQHSQPQPQAQQEQKIAKKKWKKQFILDTYRSALANSQKENYKKHVENHKYITNANTKIAHHKIKLQITANLHRFSVSDTKTSRDCLCTFYEHSETSKIQGFEKIYYDDQGKCQKKAFGSKKNAMCVFGDLELADTIYILEGVKDSLIAHQLTDQASVCVYGKCNFENVAKHFKLTFNQKSIVIVADADAVDETKKIAERLGVECIVPTFTDDELKENNNDLFDFLARNGVDETMKFLTKKQEKNHDDIFYRVQSIAVTTTHNKKTKVRKAQDIMFDIAEKLTYAIDLDENCYAIIDVNNCKKTYAVAQNSMFTKLLEDLIRSLEKRHAYRLYKGFSGQDWAKVLSVIQMIARANVSERKKAFVRFGYHDDNYYIDLCNDKSEVLEISSDSVRIIGESPVLFIKSKSQKSIDISDDDLKNGCIDDVHLLFKHINVKEALQPLVVMFLLSCMTEPPYAIAYITGSKGSGKSTLAYVLKDLIDSQEASTVNWHKDNLELLSFMKSNACLSYDNVDQISKDNQDFLCKITFSKGFSLRARALYSAHEICTTRQVPVIINAVFSGSLATDFKDRCLDFELDKLNSDQLKVSNKIWKKRYESDKAKIRVALFKLLSLYVKAKKTEDETVKQAIKQVCDDYRSTKRLRDIVEMMTTIELMSNACDNSKFYSLGATYDAYEQMTSDSMFDQLFRNQFMAWLVDNLKNHRILSTGYGYTLTDLLEKYKRSVVTDSKTLSARKIGGYLRFYEDHLKNLKITFKTRRKTSGIIYLFSVVH